MDAIQSRKELVNLRDKIFAVCKDPKKTCESKLNEIYNEARKIEW
jgi:hypothetical protein